jgi:hypothetical protein
MQRSRGEGARGRRRGDVRRVVQSGRTPSGVEPALRERGRFLTARDACMRPSPGSSQSTVAMVAAVCALLMGGRREPTPRLSSGEARASFVLGLTTTRRCRRRASRRC